MAGMATDALWASIDDERAALAGQLADLTDAQWATPSLCTGLSVREVLAHLTVGGSLSGPRWFAGVLRARFDFDRQVDARLREQLGATPEETLARFRATVGSRTSPPLPRVALLGEVVVHGEDVRRPLGLRRDHPAAVLEAVARYYAGSNLMLPSRDRVRGVRLRADDGAFAAGDGPEVRGGTLDLIMAMTGRRTALAGLTGPGVERFAAAP
jgi:uncharacterized protein (TIGR03083 family)